MSRPPLEVVDLIRIAGDAFIERTSSFETSGWSAKAFSAPTSFAAGHFDSANCKLVQGKEDWCPVWESEYLGVLKTHNLLKNRDAQNARNGKIAPNWNVSGTRVFSVAIFVRKIPLPCNRVAGNRSEFCRTQVCPFRYDLELETNSALNRRKLGGCAWSVDSMEVVGSLQAPMRPQFVQNSAAEVPAEIR